jgi:hypothetical protein
MDVIRLEKAAAVVRLTEGELRLLASAINETREAVEAWEFPTRVGSELAEAEALLAALDQVLASTQALR